MFEIGTFSLNHKSNLISVIQKAMKYEPSDGECKQSPLSEAQF